MLKTTIALCAALLLAGCATQAESKTANKPLTDQAIIYQSAANHGVPREVIQYVAKKESGLRCKPGNPRYHGPLQISQGSARALGYRGKGGLNNCGAGLEYGMRHLKLCVNKVGNNPKRAARCHASPGSFGVRLAWK